MKKHRVFTLLLALALLVPAIFGVSRVFAANPSFTIGDVVANQSVTILIKDAPKNRDFIVRMGEYDTKAINGIEAGQFHTGEGGNLQATIEIPEALKGRAQIAIRMDSLTGGWYYYNWFWNMKEGGTWPEPSQPTKTTPQAPQITPTPNKTPTKVVPLIFIKSAESSKSVTITGINFPKNEEMKAFMGEMFSKGIDGVEVGLFTTSDTGTFEMTFEIPAELVDHERVAIRVASVPYTWYAYNWFWNKAGGIVVTQPPSQAVRPLVTEPAKKHPLISIVQVEAGKTVTIKADNLPANTEFTVLLGKMYTKGLNGIAVATFDSGENTSAQLTVDIPTALATEDLIAIRIQSKSRGFAYNWFSNK